MSLFKLQPKIYGAWQTESIACVIKQDDAPPLPQLPQTIKLKQQPDSLPTPLIKRELK